VKVEHKQETCPKCGYCPHCGRGGQQFVPYPVYPWGTWPGQRWPSYPYVTWSTVGQSSVTVSGLQNVTSSLPINTAGGSYDG